jgi:caa(3)-type oxidase subunit IV
MLEFGSGGNIMAVTQPYNSSVGKYLVVYVCILAIAALQFVIAYSNASLSQMFVRMSFLAVVEAGLALLFFMHLSENRGLRWFVLIFTIAVILGMQYGWTDSFRLHFGAPWAT